MAKEEDLESQETVVTSRYSSSISKWPFPKLVLQPHSRLIKRSTNPQNVLAPVAVPDSREFEAVTIIHTPTSTEVTLDSNNNCHDHINDQLHTQLKSINTIIRQSDLDSLRAFGGPSTLVEALGTDIEIGIPRHDEHHCFRQACKPSSLEAPEKGLVRRLLGSSNNYIILLLVISGILSIGFGIKEEGPRTGWFEGFIILFAVVVLVFLPLIHSKIWLHKKHGDTVEEKETMVDVVRGGNRQGISTSNVLLGDIVCLKRGHRIPGDGLLVSGDFLELDDHSSPKAVINSDNPFLFYGAEVRNGEGKMLVTALGEDTKWAEAMDGTTHLDKTLPFTTQIDRVNTWKQIVGLVISVLIVVILFLRYEFAKDRPKSGILDVKGKPIAVEEFKGVLERVVIKPSGKISTLMTSLVMLIVGVVEGLPFHVAASVSYWSRKGLAFARELSACVEVGSATTICTDLVGGLTSEPLEVCKFWIGEEEMNEDSVIVPIVCQALCEGISASLLLPQALVTTSDEPLLSWAALRFCTELTTVRHRLTVVQVDELIGSEGRGVLIMKNNEDNRTKCLHYQGLASKILPMCSLYYNNEGLPIDMDDQKAMAFHKIVECMQFKDQLKVIAFAYKQTDTPTFDAANLILLGLVGLRKRVREEIKDSINVCHCAGVRIILVSSEDAENLATVAQKFDIISQNRPGTVIRGDEFRKLKDEERIQMVSQVSVMGNSLPSDKLQLAESLKKSGEIVCVVGKNTNDAPVLKAADVGVVMGCWSNDVARASADIVLWGTNIGSLVPVLRYGRCINSNIRNYLKLELTMLVAGLLVGVISVTCTGSMPVTTIQACWVNVVVPLLGGLAILTEGPSDSQMQLLRKGHSAIITTVMWASIVSQSVYQATVLATFQFKLRGVIGLEKNVGETMVFNSFVLCQVFNQLDARVLFPKGNNKLAMAIRKSYKFWLVLGVTVVLQVIFIEISHSVAGNARLNVAEWGICFGIGMASLVIDWVEKLILGFFNLAMK